MKPVFPSLVLLGALFLASCDDSASVQPSAPAPDTAATLDVLDDIVDFQRKDVGFRRVSFQVQGGITGRGTGESLTLDDRGLLVRIAAKPLQTDSGPQWSGRYDTTRQRLRAADLQHVDSLLRSIRERPRKDLPDSTYSRCHTIADGFYWTAGVLWLDSDIATDWQIPSLSCTDKDGNMVPVPVPESITALQALERHLLTTYFPSDSAPTHKPVCLALKNPLPDLKAFSCTWTSLEPIYSSTVHLDSLGTLTASRPVFGSGESRLSGYPMETRSICLDSATMVAIRDSLLLPAVIQAPRLVERDPRCADGGHTTFKIERVDQESILLNDQDCHPNTPSPEGYQIAERVARSLFEAAFPSE